MAVMKLLAILATLSYKGWDSCHGHLPGLMVLTSKRAVVTSRHLELEFLTSGFRAWFLWFEQHTLKGFYNKERLNGEWRGSVLRSSPFKSTLQERVVRCGKCKKGCLGGSLLLRLGKEKYVSYLTTVPS